MNEPGKHVAMKSTMDNTTLKLVIAVAVSPTLPVYGQTLQGNVHQDTEITSPASNPQELRINRTILPSPSLSPENASEAIQEGSCRSILPDRAFELKANREPIVQPPKSSLP
jgi:hypothetical protein